MPRSPSFSRPTTTCTKVCGTYATNATKKEFETMMPVPENAKRACRHAQDPKSRITTMTNTQNTPIPSAKPPTSEGLPNTPTSSRFLPLLPSPLRLHLKPLPRPIPMILKQILQISRRRPPLLCPRHTQIKTAPTHQTALRIQPGLAANLRSWCRRHGCARARVAR